MPSPIIWRRKNRIPAVILRKVMYSTWCRNLKMTYLLQLARKWLAYYPNSENGLPTSSRKWHSSCHFQEGGILYFLSTYPQCDMKSAFFTSSSKCLKVPDIQPAIICEITYCLTSFREWQTVFFHLKCGISLPLFRKYHIACQYPESDIPPAIIWKVTFCLPSSGKWHTTCHHPESDIPPV